MEFNGERYVPEYDEPIISYAHWHRYLYAPMFVKDKVVLDIACGEGYGSHLLARTAKEVVGIDISSEAISHASAKYRCNNLRFDVGSVTAIPVTGEEIFDVIVSFETIEHVTEQDQGRFLEEVKRLLKTDGLFIVSTPNRSMCGDIPQYKNEFHLREFYVQEFRDFLGHYFKNVVLLGHNLYSGSYLWNLESDTKDLSEFSLDLSENGFYPAESRKDILYMLGVCSDNAIDNLNPSLLIDRSQRVFKLLMQHHAEIEQKDRQIESLSKLLNDTMQKAADLEQRPSGILKRFKLLIKQAF